MLPRHPRLLIFICLINLLTVSFLHFDGAPKPAHADNAVADAAMEIVAAVNSHRTNMGLHPLALNTTLTTMATAQVSYLETQNYQPVNYDYHIDANGEYPRQRALRYGWPTYGSSQQIEIGENAGVGSLNYMMEYWRSSPLHKTAMENPAYREIGVGIKAHKYGFFIILVFGSRPNVFPGLFNPESCEVYTPNEAHLMGTGTWLRAVQTLQLVKLDGTPLTEPMTWQPKLSIPAHSDSEFYVVFSGQNQQIQAKVNMQSEESVAITPNTLPMLRSDRVTTACVGNAQTTPPVLSTTNEAEVTAQIPATQPTAPVDSVVKVETTTSTANLNPTAPTLLGRVNVNRGSNLQCREYPSPTAFSLGLIPNDAEIAVLGLPGARDERIGHPDGLLIEVPDYAAARLGAGIDLSELWLNVEWQMPDGARLGCWVNSFYISLAYQGISIYDAAQYLELVEEGVMTFTPYNTPGGVRN